jgi:hypothetical protein
MQSVLTIQSFIWIVMASVVGSLALYRKYVSRGEVDILHLGANEGYHIPLQEAMAHRLEAIDRWGKILTIVLIVYGVLIACGYMVLAWRSTNLPVS